MEFKVGDKVRIKEDSEYYDDQSEQIGIGTIIDYHSSIEIQVKNQKSGYSNAYKNVDLELAESANGIPNTKMTKKVMRVLVVDKKKGTITKDETVVADNEQHAILKAFGVDANEVHIKVTEVTDYEETKPATVVLEKDAKK